MAFFIDNNNYVEVDDFIMRKDDELEASPNYHMFVSLPKTN